MRKPVVFDIEGTIGDIAFVRNVLFPYARSRTEPYLKSHWQDDEMQAILASAREASCARLHNAEEASAQFIEWMDQDRKITPLKTLQGILWREGYESGELKAHLYTDAVEAFERWHRKGHPLYIYSSGSIAAQKLFLAYSVAGNLTGYFSGYFDTTTGPKAERASYEAIANEIGEAPGNITFFSDAVPEIEAARLAGISVWCVDRSRPQLNQVTPEGYPLIGSFAYVSDL